MLVGGSRCVFAGGEHGHCEGRLEFHHAIKQQRLKREFPLGALWNVELSHWSAVRRHKPPAWCPTLPLSDILGDTRNRVWLCSFHHEKVTNGRLRLELPESVWDFAKEFGLEAQLENDLARQVGRVAL